MIQMPLDDLFRRAVDLNLRYYASVGQLTADYLKDLAAAVVASSPAATAHTAPPQQPHSPPSPNKGPMMVFEADAGHAAVGAFIVENHLAHEVRATVAASKLLDPAGSAVELPFVFEPPVVSLQPREQVIVRATVVIGEWQKPGFSYSGQISIPELGGTSVPIVVRRASLTP
jgi:hypothetical protein